MGSLLVRGESASELFLDELLGLFRFLQGLLVRCLLGLFHFGSVLPGLLVEFLFGLYLFLVMLLG